MEPLKPVFLQGTSDASPEGTPGYRLLPESQGVPPSLRNQSPPAITSLPPKGEVPSLPRRATAAAVTRGGQAQAPPTALTVVYRPRLPQACTYRWWGADTQRWVAGRCLCRASL